MDCVGNKVENEANVAAAAYCYLTQWNYDVELEVYMGQTPYGRARPDMLLRDTDGEIAAIIEFKNPSKYKGEEGACDCEKTEFPQFKKYCSFDYPLFICNGYKLEELKAFVDYHIM